MSNPGELLKHQEIETSIKGAKAWKVRYRSIDVNSKAHEVTGVVIAPAAPGTDRPVMTWGHGTTGMGDASCPSAQPDPARELITYFQAESTQQIDYGVPGLQGFIDEGWVVCATDYQGLGTPGRHQYTVNRTQARDCIYMVHAARSLPVGAGTTVGAMGWSQGGGTAAAIAELDPADYADLNLIGVVPMSPAVPKAILSLMGSAPPASGASEAAGLANHAGPPDGHIVLLLAGNQAAHPDELELSDMFTPLGVEIINTAWNHQPIHHISDVIGRMFRLKGPIFNNPPKNLPTWESALAAGSAALIKPVCPVLVCMDTFDGGTVLPVPVQQAYVTAARALGGNVETREYPHDDHFSLPASCVQEARAWLTSHLP